MDNAVVADRYRQQPEARPSQAGLLISSDPAAQFNDHGDQHFTRTNLGMLLCSAAVDPTSTLFIQETPTQHNGCSPLITSS